MKSRWHVVGVATVAAIAQLWIASTGEAGQRLLQRNVDPATGAEVRLYQGQRAGKDVSVEIEDGSVLIRKEIADGTSLTTVVSGEERISVALGRGGLVVTSGAGRISADREHPEQLEAARGVVSRSAAVGRATTLLGKLASGPDSPLRHAVRVTRAMLLSAAGHKAGAQELSSWARAAREKLQVMRVSLEEGPGECWLLYALEAIAAYMEYEDCMANEQWWDIFGMIACAFIYDLRALGAFSWWITCVGFRG